MAAKAQEAVAVAVRVRGHDGGVPNCAAADVTSSADMAELGCDMCHNFLKMFVNFNTKIKVKLSHVLSGCVLPILLCTLNCVR